MTLKSKLQHKLVQFIIRQELKKLKENKNMNKILEGKKTYLVALAFAIIAFAEHLGWVTKDLALEIVTFLNGAGFAALRAVKK